MSKIETMAKILALESFYGGSHKYFIDKLIYYSHFDFDLITLPARHWKWRYSGSAFDLLQQVDKREKYDLIFTGNLINVADIKAFWGKGCPPIFLYCHENQLNYPLAAGVKRDFSYAYRDYLNILHSAKTLFNSDFNRKGFFKEITEFLKRMPDGNLGKTIEETFEKTAVISPGIDKIEGEKKENKCPVLLWNHRWEHDKNPDDFFQFLKHLSNSKIDFQFYFTGGKYEKVPLSIKNGLNNFSGNLLMAGYCANRKEYEKILLKSDFVISTAFQENFGISVWEAVGAGSIPLLPNRLAYPEILPERFHSECLYSNKQTMLEKFKKLQSWKLPLRRDLQLSIEPYFWKNKILEFDSVFEEVLSNE